MLRPITKPENTKPVVTKHPSQNFILYLILTNTPVVETLRSLDLPDMPLGYEDHIRNTMVKPPKEFDPTNKFHKESMRYLKELGIYNLYFPDRYTLEAKSYLNDPDVKEHVEQLLLVRKPTAFKPADIAKKVNAKFDTLYTEDGVDRYRHYFWNVRLMKLSDWEKIFNNPSEKSRVKSAVKNVAGYTLAKLGFHVKMETKEMLREALGHIYLDMQDWSNRAASPDKTKALSTIIHDICTIDDRLSNMDITMKETLKQFEKFRVEHAKALVSPIHNTAAIGNYSHSGMQLQEAKLDDLSMLESPTEARFVLEAHEEE